MIKMSIAELQEVRNSVYISVKKKWCMNEKTLAVSCNPNLDLTLKVEYLSSIKLGIGFI